jgi:hypothetical protein
MVLQSQNSQGGIQVLACLYVEGAFAVENQFVVGVGMTGGGIVELGSLFVGVAAVVVAVVGSRWVEVGSLSVEARIAVVVEIAVVEVAAAEARRRN